MVTTAKGASPEVSASIVLISFRSEVNGISPTREKRSTRSSWMPSLRSATRNAPSVGSPWIDQTPSSFRKIASLAQAAASEHGEHLVAEGPFGQRTTRDSTSPVGL